MVCTDCSVWRVTGAVFVISVAINSSVGVVEDWLAYIMPWNDTLERTRAAGASYIICVFVEFVERWCWFFLCHLWVRVVPYKSPASRLGRLVLRFRIVFPFDDCSVWLPCSSLTYPQSSDEKLKIRVFLRARAKEVPGVSAGGVGCLDIVESFVI